MNKNLGSLAVLLSLMLCELSCGKNLDSATGGIGEASIRPGDLDSSYGTGGISKFDVTSVFEVGAALQGDGKLVIGSSEYLSSAKSNFKLMRLREDGQLDSTFGSGGIVTSDFGGKAQRFYAVAIQNDGKILAAGNWDDEIFGNEILVARYNSDGSLDQSFGTSGKVKTSLSTTDAFGRAMAIQPDGKILVAGYSYYSSSYHLMVRYTSTGTLDTTFGSGGIVRTVTGTGAYHNYIHAIAFQADGKILTAGSLDVDSRTDLAVVRYTSTGEVDSTFGSSGKAIFPLSPAAASASAVAVLSDGKILVGGHALLNATWNDFVLLRLLPDGSQDSTFGTNGLVVTDVSPENGFDGIKGFKVDSQGRILAVGYCDVPGAASGSYEEPAMVRYSSDGSLDATFGENGIVIVSMSKDKGEAAEGVELTSDGKAIVYGSRVDQIFALRVSLGGS